MNISNENTYTHIWPDFMSNSCLCERVVVVDKEKQIQPRSQPLAEGKYENKLVCVV